MAKKPPISFPRQAKDFRYGNKATFDPRPLLRTLYEIGASKVKLGDHLLDRVKIRNNLMLDMLIVKRSLVNSFRSAKTFVKHGRLRNSDPKVLLDALEIIPNSWLFAGTLLGAIRDKKLIKWDGDIDIGCACEDITKDVLIKLVDSGFQIKKHYILTDPRMRIYIPQYEGKAGKIILEKKGTKLEVCCFASGNPNIYMDCEVMYFGGNGPRLFVIPRDFIYPSKVVTFCGVGVNVPENSEQKLEFMYGETWRIPRRNWYLTADHYLCRERTIIELGDDDGTKWSKWVGRRKIMEEYGVQDFPSDINEPFSMGNIAKNALKQPPVKSDAKMTTVSGIDPDTIYQALCSTCEVLDQLGCKYFVAGGTLLGAVRSNDIIPHDTDFDIDCLIEDEGTIINGEKMFAVHGIKVTKQMSLAPERLNSSEQTRKPLYCSCLHVEYKGSRIGDIYIYTIFDDGIARRFDLESGLYANPKMAIPAWYYSGEEYVNIRDRKFRSIRAADIVLEKVYGVDWRTPLKPGQYTDDRNSTSGSISDADIEKLIYHALTQGWMGGQAGAPSWPPEIKWLGWPADVSRKWVFRHEPMIHEDIASLVQNSPIISLFEPEEAGRVKSLCLMAAAIAVQSEKNFHLKYGLDNSRSFSPKGLLLSLPVPKKYKIRIRNLLKSVYAKGW